MSKPIDKNTHNNTVWHQPTLCRHHREATNQHKGAILWFTGLSGSGKSTLAYTLEYYLYQSMQCKTFVLDGDNVRQGLCRDLGFSNADRKENIRRIGEVSKLMLDAGILVLTAFISPFREDREIARKLVEKEDFIEIFCNADIKVCKNRDVKGLYKKAYAGHILEFTGVSSPYESPQNPELELNTGSDSIQECIQTIVQYLIEKHIVDQSKFT